MYARGRESARFVYRKVQTMAAENANPLLKVKLVRMPEVVEATGLSKRTVEKWCRDGRFPAPVRLSARAIAWRVSDVEEWIESRENIV